MTRFGWTVVSGAVVLILASAGLFLFIHARQAASLQKSTASVITDLPPTDPTQVKLYSNGTYGFSLTYPSNAQLFDGDSASSTRPESIAIERGQTLVLYITQPETDVSVLVSTSTPQKTKCSATRPGEVATGLVISGSTTWNSFIRDELGTDIQTHDILYRMVHEGNCVTLLARQPYSVDSSALHPDIAEILSSFSFATR